MKKYKQTNSLKCEDGVDMISNLPDPIIHLILSCLPTTEEVIRTCILSTRWRHLWTSVACIDINFSRGLKPFNELRKNKFKEFVCRVLANNSVDLDSFRLSSGNYYDMLTVGQWLEAAVRRKIKVLDLMFGCLYEDIELPHCLVTCGSLEVLRLNLLENRLTLPKFTDFPALRVLELKSLEFFNQELSEEFLKSCPLLEDLSLINCSLDINDVLCISCPKLENLRICNSGGLVIGQIQICCPKLVFLEFQSFMANVFMFESLVSLKKAVIHPPATFQWAGNDLCELLAGISHVENLKLDICLIEQDINVEDLPESLPNLKTLELTTKNIGGDMMINVVIKVLKCFPNLESLSVNEDSDLDPSSTLEYPDFDFFGMECTFEKLKEVFLVYMSGVPHHIMGLIKFLLESTPFLETMGITPCLSMTYEESSVSEGLLEEFVKEVHGFERASPGADIIFEY